MSTEQKNPDDTNRRDAETQSEKKPTFTRRLTVRIEFDELECDADENGMPSQVLRFENSKTVDEMESSNICQEAQEMFDRLVARLELNLENDGGVH